MEPNRFDDEEQPPEGGAEPIEVQSSDHQARVNRPAEGARQITPGEAFTDETFLESAGGADFLGLELDLNTAEDGSDLTRISLDEPPPSGGLGDSLGMEPAPQDLYGDLGRGLPEPAVDEELLFDDDPERDLELDGQPWIADQVGEEGELPDGIEYADALREGEEGLFPEGEEGEEELVRSGLGFKRLALFVVIGFGVGAAAIFGTRALKPADPGGLDVARAPVAGQPTPDTPTAGTAEQPLAPGPGAGVVVEPLAPPPPLFDPSAPAALAAVHPLGGLVLLASGELAQAQADGGLAGGPDPQLLLGELLADLGPPGGPGGGPGSIPAPPEVPAIDPGLLAGDLTVSMDGVTADLSGIVDQGALLASTGAGSLSMIWQAPEVPMELMAAQHKVLTPSVGPVRVLLDSGDVFEGNLEAVGLERIWLENNLGLLVLDGGRIASVERVVPPGSSGRVDPADIAPGETVRVDTPGGWIYGRVLARKDKLVTLVTESGGRIMLDDPVIEPVGLGASLVIQ